MTIARKHQISLECTPYYHCVSRCVRRAFLCGKDRYTGKSFEHRRRWIEQRILFLAKVFAIDVCAYAVMSNHYHLVVRLAPAKAQDWDETEVLRRWGQVFAVPVVVAETNGQGPSHDGVTDWISVYRERLGSLSWFMRCINEPLARRSNREDDCSGRFWEGRFKVQALLDEAALLRCMAYVDLNPIRAKLATTPETSVHTSVHARIKGEGASLLGFEDQQARPALPCCWKDYLTLVEWTGREWSQGKRGRIDSDLPFILERLETDQETWLKDLRRMNSWHGRALGSLEALQAYCEHLGQRWMHGLQHHLIPARAAATAS
ncbi:MAG: transposase [Proteobacteria bacterium]|nr:transposase [Pseudomonadota bacterium]